MKKEKDHIKKIENSSLLYPYNGRSLNLIDKFYIFGYNYLTLKKYLIDKTPNIPTNFLNNDQLGFFQLEEDPSLLTEITNDLNKEIVEPEIIKSLIFPNGLFIFYSLEKENDINTTRNISYQKNHFDFDKTLFPKIDLSEDKTGCPKGHRAVFSLTPKEGDIGRKCQNGFAYTFYRKFWKIKEIGGKRIVFYIPYTFCIVSEFPFYRSYEKLFRCIRKMFAQKYIYIPIEILLYKIVSLTPSPINTDIILDLDLMCNQIKIKNEINDLLTPNVRRATTDTNILNFKMGKKFKPKFNKLLQEDFVIIEENEISSLEIKNKMQSNDPFETIVKFKYLSGYPIIQYNLAKVLFHKLNIEKIIDIFLFTFLEQNVIFFSENLEYLSLTLNSYANFNYPLNDAEYFYNIGAISLKNFQNDETQFGIKNSTSIIGINNKFVENYLSKTSKIGGHIIVDLDEGEIMIARQNKQDFDNDKLTKLISDIIEEKPESKYMEGTHLYFAIKQLYKRLNEIYEKKNIYFYLDFTFFNDEPYIGSIEEFNKSLQEAFYECIIIMSFYLYENILIMDDKKQHMDSMKVEFSKKYEDDQKYNREELMIISELLESMKLKGSFNQFVMEHNPIDLFKIPLTFTDEFVSIFAKKKFAQNIKKIKYFELIDKLYYSRKLGKIEKIDFTSDIKKYISNFKNKFDRDIIEREIKKGKNNYSNLIKAFDYEETKILKYQTYELDEKILLKYLCIISNLSPGKYLELISDNFLKEENYIKEISMTEVEKRIEDYFIENNYLTNDELFCANLLLLFCLSLKYFPEGFQSNDDLSFLLQNFPTFRKHISLLLQILYKLYVQSLEENNHYMTKRMEYCFYHCFNIIQRQKIIPNENLIYIINKFLKALSEVEKNNKKDKENEMNEEKNIIDKGINLDISEQNLFMAYNFSTLGFYDENYIIETLTKSQMKFFSVYTGEKDEMITPRIRYVRPKKSYIESGFLSQREMYQNLLEEYNKYIENLDINEINKNNTILNSCLNLFVYIRNNEELNDFDELKKILENIFYIFLPNK